MSSMKLDPYETTLLNGWEDVHRKSQVSLWILLSLRNKARHMAEIKLFIHTRSNKTVTADDQSLYRALRRFTDAEMVTYTNAPSKSGPDKKLYQLTPAGKRILTAFIDRNIKNVFFNPYFKRMIERSNHAIQSEN